MAWQKRKKKENPIKLGTCLYNERSEQKVRLWFMTYELLQNTGKFICNWEKKSFCSPLVGIINLKIHVTLNV